MLIHPRGSKVSSGRNVPKGLSVQLLVIQKNNNNIVIFLLYKLICKDYLGAFTESLGGGLAEDDHGAEFSVCVTGMQ